LNKYINKYKVIHTFKRIILEATTPRWFTGFTDYAHIIKFI